VEFAVHGSRYNQRQLLNVLTSVGARIAEPGEFTRRAFMNGKLDLAEAEAIADVIAADSRAAHRIAANQMRGQFSQRLASLRAQLVDLASLLELELDFSEEDVEFADRRRLIALAQQVNDEISRLHRSFAAGSAIKDGIPVAIVGATNAGKSSLLNALVGDDRAIVSDIHGTTRDTIEETISIGDYTFRFIDTAGLRRTDDIIEQQGIIRSQQAIAKARIVISVVDSTEALDTSILEQAAQPLRESDTPGYLIIALNKSDLKACNSTIAQAEEFAKSLPPHHAITAKISTITGQGLNDLQQALTTAAETDNQSADEGILVTNARHAQALSDALTSTRNTIDALHQNLPGDLIAQHLRATIAHLASITGDIPSSEILNTIFSRFCIGK
jgi:tRNA modification GTPase